MKLFTCAHNYFGLKTAITLDILNVHCEVVETNPCDKVVPFLQHPRLPVLELSDGEYLFSANAICRYLWTTKGGNNAPSVEEEEWLEWESCKLQPSVVIVLSNTYSNNKVEKQYRALLNDNLKHLDSFLSKNTYLHASSSDNLHLSAIVIWSTLYPLSIDKTLSEEYFLPFRNITRWFENTSKHNSFQKGTQLIFKGKDPRVCKESLQVLAAAFSVLATISPEMSPKTPTEIMPNATNDEISLDDLVNAEEIANAFEAWQLGRMHLPQPKKFQPPVLPQENEKNVLITSALPYVNNVPHLGNIIGSVLSADVFARYCRKRNYNTLYICGTDEYGTATETKALEMNVTPQEICDKFHKIHSDIYKWFNISFDYFGRTTTEHQTTIAQDIFLKLQKNDYLEEESVEQLFCDHCSRFLADRFVEGICPFCQYEDARGDQCDKCSKLINPTELGQPRCKLCKKTPALKTSKHLFLNLPKLEPALLEWFKNVTKKGGWTQTARVITNSWLRDGLKPRCITRDLKWGTPVPVDGYKDKVFYVWFDAPIGYLSITATYTSEWEKWWKQPDQVELFQFMAKDNVPFHGTIFPASQLGTGDNYTKVNNLKAVEYLNYEDTKFSKSRGVGVFGNDAQDTGIPSDVWRFYLLYIRPESQDTSFCWSDLQLKNNSELLNNLGNFINRALSFLHNNFGGVMPSLDVLEEDKVLIAQVSKQLTGYIQLMEKTRYRDAIRSILNISRLGNQYIQSHKPWELVKGAPEQKARSGTIVGIACNIGSLLSALLHPFMPETSEALQKQLNSPDFVLTPQFVCLLPPGHKIAQPYPLFKKIENDQIAELKKRFEGKQPTPEKEIPNNKAPVKKASPVNHVINGAGDNQLKIEELTLLLEQQGNKVRQLKASKAEKGVIDVEVGRLLDLKRQLAVASGKSPDELISTGQSRKKKGKK